MSVASVAVARVVPSEVFVADCGSHRVARTRAA
jgi:hypothetical protein